MKKLLRVIRSWIYRDWCKSCAYYQLDICVYNSKRECISINKEWGNVKGFIRKQIKGGIDE